MIKKLTLLGIADNCGIKQVKVIHNYLGFQKLTSGVGDFIKVSVRKRKYNYSWIKNKRVYVPLKGKKFKSYFLRARYRYTKNDGSVFFFKENTTAILKKRMTMRGRYVRGPFIYGLKRKKIIASFAGLL